MPPIRPATPDDQPAIEAIVRAAYTPYIPRMGREPGPMLDDYTALIARGRVHVLDQAGTIQGLLVLVPQPDTMLLDNIAIHPDAQGTGLGRLMLDHAEHQAKAAGYGTITLYTNAAMTENLGLYAHLGYIETQRITEKGFHRVYMRKQLG